MSIVRPRSAAEPWRLVLVASLLLLLLLLLQACAAPPPPAPSTSPPAPPTAEAAALGGRMTADAQEYPWSALGRLNLAGQGFCTGVLVGPTQVLTQADRKSTRLNSSH